MKRLKDNIGRIGELFGDYRFIISGNSLEDLTKADYYSIHANEILGATFHRYTPSKELQDLIDKPDEYWEKKKDNFLNRHRAAAQIRLLLKLPPSQEIDEKVNKFIRNMDNDY